MAQIRKLDKSTIDLIAAGEVIERPSSVVKELVENAIDAGAKAVTVEIRGGGIDFIRVTDDGCGIPADEVRAAFESHATSKIERIEDLFTVRSLGFRGEALSSVAAVAKVDMITKTKEQLSGMRISIYGGEEESLEEIGAPEGTTVVVRDLFYNTLPRRKFLKRVQTEASYVGALVERLALAFPDVAFRYLKDNREQLITSGNGDYRELIFRIFGKEAASAVRPLFTEEDGYTLVGYLGEPSLNRANRNFEIFFVNGRYVRDRLLSRALEEGCREYLMQHRFPFAVLMLEVPPDVLDVNAHPSKMEVRFHEPDRLSLFLKESVEKTLAAHEMIPEAMESDREEKPPVQAAKARPEPFERSRISRLLMQEGQQVLLAEGNRAQAAGQPVMPSPIIKQDRQVYVDNRAEQMQLFDVKLLTKEHREEYRILGQVFETYWILAFRDKMYIVDQHAAHEKVNYERMLKRYHDGDMMSQLLNPPLIVTLSEAEERVFLEFQETFRALGFQAESFGAHSYALRAVPMELYGAGERELFLSVLDELSDSRHTMDDPALFTQRIATMACKASVKGNTSMHLAEMEALLDELLTLDNPYNCPHGRPTIISMSKYEIDKKFKRIV